MAQREAGEAIFDHIVEALAEAKTDCGAAARAEAIKNLAVAYRLVAGGPQPGGSVVSS